MSDQQSDLAYQEVDEEIRRERMQALWKAYGKYIIGIAIAIVVVVAGNETYNSYRKSVEEANSSTFTAALDASQEIDADPVQVWQGAQADMQEGYAALSQLRLAAATLNAGDAEGAIAIYEGLATDASADQALQDIATLNAAMIVYSHRGDIEVARSMFSTIAISGRAWYHSALEQLAIIDMQTGDMDSALLRFATLADDVQTPPTIRQRAQDFRTSLENQALIEDIATASGEEGGAS